MGTLPVFFARNRERGERHRRIGFLVFFILLLSSALPAGAVDSELTRKTLVGLKGVAVVVENMPAEMGKYEPSFDKAGLTAPQIKQTVETRVRAAGIPVVSGQAWIDTPGRPILYIRFNAHETARYQFAYNTHVGLKQLVHLEANPALKTLAATWSMDMTGKSDLGRLNLVSESIRFLVDRFIGAYKEANAKR